MLTTLRKVIRNYILRTIGGEEITDMIENGFNEEDQAVILEMLNGQSG